jgi:3-hydroxybutyryl-CoA dehydrogenase
MKKIGVLGAGTMGAGIAQVAAQAGHDVVLVDLNSEMLNKAKNNLAALMVKLVEKEKVTAQSAKDIQARIRYSIKAQDFAECDLVIEAIIEKLDVKHSVFKELESIVSQNCILASNTSSLSIASIGSVLQNPSRVIGIHFFNPAPLMALVEIIPAVQTSKEILETTTQLISSWKKKTVECKDTPGFIVNRVARPFYSEALKIYEEGIADFATIDWAMTTFGGFKMGPFTLMDYIGNDINYTVTETVWTAFYYDTRFKPSLTQKRYSEAGYLGKKSGRGFYDYSENSLPAEPIKDEILGKQIFHRVLSVLINIAFDAKFMNVASQEDIDLAMMNGVNYPKGLFAWSEEIGLSKVHDILTNLFNEYGEERYRPNVLMTRSL